ncbi:hypothetical protein ACFQ3Z_40995 [Streptomyces nogalater]
MGGADAVQRVGGQFAAGGQRPAGLVVLRILVQQGADREEFGHQRGQPGQRALGPLVAEQGAQGPHGRQVLVGGDGLGQPAHAGIAHELGVVDQHGGDPQPQRGDRHQRGQALPAQRLAGGAEDVAHALRRGDRRAAEALFVGEGAQQGPLGGQAGARAAARGGGQGGGEQRGAGARGDRADALGDVHHLPRAPAQQFPGVLAVRRGPSGCGAVRSHPTLPRLDDMGRGRGPRRRAWPRSHGRPAGPRPHLHPSR